MTDQNFQDEEERQQYAAWRAGYQDPEAAARGAWIAAKHGWAIAQSLQADFAQLKEQMAAIGAGGVEPLRKKAAPVAPEATPIAWYVTGCRTMMDELDAKAEARRCGGSAKAVPLYTAPPALAAQAKQGEQP